VLITAMTIARTQVATLREYTGRLIAIGLSNNWARQVLLIQASLIICISTSIALLLAVAPIATAALRMPELELSIPWHWLLPVSVIFFGANALATIISSRRLRASDRFAV
jgi:hypothetical protein